MWRGTSFSTFLHGTVIVLLLFGLPSLPLIFKRTSENPEAVAGLAPGTAPEDKRRGDPGALPEMPERPSDRPAGGTGDGMRAIEVMLVPASEFAAFMAARPKAEPPSKARPPPGPGAQSGTAVVIIGDGKPPAEEKPANEKRSGRPAKTTPPGEKVSSGVPVPQTSAPSPAPSAAPPAPGATTPANMGPVTPPGETAAALPGATAPSAAPPAGPLTAALQAIARHNRQIELAVRPADPVPATSAQAARRRTTFERIKKAAALGYPNAQFNLARMLLTGTGTPPDPAEATRVLERAAERGYTPAQLLLAYNAIAAPPKERDLARADFWLSVAEQRNSKAAKEARALLKPVLSLNDELRARQMRAEWRRMMAIIAPTLGTEADQETLDEELREASEKGDVDGVLNALMRGADPAGRDRFGRNAIINAAWRGRESVVRLMLERGVDIETADDKGRTPLNWASINGHRRVVEMLLAAGADPDRIDAEGTTPLIRAAWNGYPEVVDRLLAAGARIDIRDPKGLTALDYARRAGQTAVVRRLEAALAGNARRPARP